MKLSAMHLQSTENLFSFFFFTWEFWFPNGFNLAPGLLTVYCSWSGIDFKLHQFIEIVLNFKGPPSLAGSPVSVKVDKWLPYRNLTSSNHRYIKAFQWQRIIVLIFCWLSHRSHNSFSLWSGKIFSLILFAIVFPHPNAKYN